MSQEEGHLLRLGGGSGVFSQGPFVRNLSYEAESGMLRVAYPAILNLPAELLGAGSCKPMT